MFEWSRKWISAFFYLHLESFLTAKSPFTLTKINDGLDDRKKKKKNEEMTKCAEINANVQTRKKSSHTHRHTAASSSVISSERKVNCYFGCHFISLPRHLFSATTHSHYRVITSIHTTLYNGLFTFFPSSSSS